MFLTDPIFRVGFFWLLWIKGDKVEIRLGLSGDFTLCFFISRRFPQIPLANLRRLLLPTTERYTNRPLSLSKWSKWFLADLRG